jgi:hypothetical protein
MPSGTALDHIKFVDDESAGIAQSQQSPNERLRAPIQENRHTFFDLQSDPLPVDHDYKSGPGYTNVDKGMPNSFFQTISSTK